MVNGIEGREPAVRMDFDKRRKELLDYLEEERSKEQSKLSKQSKGLGTKKRGYEIQRRRRVKRKNVNTETPRSRLRDQNQSKERSREDTGKQPWPDSGLDEEGKGPREAQALEVWVDDLEQRKETGPWFWLDSGVGLGGELQKKRGIWFGQWMVRELKREFNRKFNEVIKERKRKVDQIREKDLKIREICGELKLVPPENKILHNFLERWS